MESILKQISKKLFSILLAILILIIPFGLIDIKTAFGQVEAFDIQGTTAAGFGDGSQPDIEAFDGGGNLIKEGVSCLGTAKVKGLIQGAVNDLLGGVVENPANILKVPTVSDIDADYREKEIGGITTGGFSLDSLTFCLVNTMIEYITQSTIDWAKEGFQGSPVFIEDPAHFFRTIGDIEAGEFISEITGSNLFCKPFRPQIQINLAAYQSAEIGHLSNVCTLSNRIENVENFVSGVEEGDWRDFFVFGTDPTSNPNTSYLLAHEELKSRVAREQTVAQLELDWGEGFLSIKDEAGNITTPGSIIEEQINQRLGGGQRRIEMADEFDELVNVLITSIIKVAINEVFAD